MEVQNVLHEFRNCRRTNTVVRLDWRVISSCNGKLLPLMGARIWHIGGQPRPNMADHRMILVESACDSATASTGGKWGRSGLVVPRACENMQRRAQNGNVT